MTITNEIILKAMSRRGFTNTQSLRILHELNLPRSTDETIAALSALQYVDETVFTIPTMRLFLEEEGLVRSFVGPFIRPVKQ